MPNQTASENLIREPLKYSGSLDQYEHQDLTAAIGREYPHAQLSELLADDAKLRDLAITGKLAYSLRYICTVTAA